MEMNTTSNLKMSSLKYFVCKILLCGLFWTSVLASPPSTLKLVNVLYRHGDRSPAYIYPKDIHQVPGSWPDGLGWLTNIGKMQQYELGKYLGERYGGFINTTYYHHDEILVQASGVERCLMSAYSNLAGLFPVVPHGAQEWNPDLLWQPIPVQTRPLEEDNKLAITAPCPRYDQLIEEVLHSPAIRKEEEENKEFYEMISQETGVKKENLRDIWMIADPLICERAHNMTWNEWAQKPGVWEKLNQLRTWSFDLLHNTTEMSKLKGGPLLKEIITNMEATVDQSQQMPKFYMYSGHDTTVAALLSAMRVFDRHQPMYRALVMVELHEIENEHYVKIFYKNTTGPTLAELNPAGCEFPCKLSTFVKVTEATVPKDWKAECVALSSASSDQPVSVASWVALCIGLSLSAVICIALVITVLRLRRRRRDTVYTQL